MKCSHSGCKREALSGNEYCSVHGTFHADNLGFALTNASAAVLLDTATLNDGIEGSWSLADKIIENSETPIGKTVGVAVGIAGTAVSMATSAVVQGLKNVATIATIDSIKDWLIN